MPNINEAFPSNYLKASDLQGHSVVVTLDRVEFEAVGRDREMKPVVYFVGKQKGVVLNKTNAKKITELAGSALTEDWQGTTLVLYPTETEFGGETVECIRIKAVAKLPRQQPAMVAPPLPPPRTSNGADNDHLTGPIYEDEIPF